MKNLFLIAGPCVIENDQTPFAIAEAVSNTCKDLDIPFIFKASYQKANRTRVDSFTGIEPTRALEIIQEVGNTYGVRTLTDVHESPDVPEIARYVDVLQIPAFLCRQTPLLLAAGRTGKAIHLKKGQFMSPEAMQFSIDKIKSTGNQDVWVCERGFTMGYNDLVVDATSIARLKQLQVPVVMDCTHSLQKPNQTSGVTGGDPSMIETLTRFAVATGADGLFIETHTNPSEALSDGASMLPVDQLKKLLETAVKIRSSLPEYGRN